MDNAEFVETLRREGRLLADAAGAAGLDAVVPTCPGWRVRDLLRHTGAVHRWATAYVAEGRRERVACDESAPGDADLPRWYRDLHAGLADALAGAPRDLDCWYFLAASSPLAFWCRRQAHETTIHRVDAQSALGAAPSPVDPAFAADGVDELLTGFHVRSRSAARCRSPRTLRVHASDTGGDWLLRLSADPPVVERGARPGEPGTAGAGGGWPAADCTMSGAAADLYLALWNRSPYDALTISGDETLADLWRRTSAVL